MGIKIEKTPSPNCDSRDGQMVDMLVLHYTGMKSGKEALERLCDEQAQVSSHYLVEEDGRVFQLVEESERAWHAGVSHWHGQKNVNHRSVGIEIVNPGHEWGYRAFPEVQMEAVSALCKDILSRHTIPPRNVVGHSDVAFLRKQDPGELFDWKGLARQGIGLWHDNPPPHHGYRALKRGDGGEAVRQMQEALSLYGYDMPVDGMFGEFTELAVIAFQRHFRGERVDGVWDDACDARLHTLLGKI